MLTLAERAVQILDDLGIRLDPGLDTTELGEVERRYGIRFGDDHRALLSLAVPAGERWVDWRDGDPEEIRRRIAWPHDSAVWHVLNDVKDWPRSWGLGPDVDAAIEATARRHLARWHPLVPLFGHRYLPAAPAPLGSPVFSVYQIDVSRYGVDLVDYLDHEMHPCRPRTTHGVQHIYYPWSQLAYGPEPADLPPPPPMPMPST